VVLSFEVRKKAAATLQGRVTKEQEPRGVPPAEVTSQSGSPVDVLQEHCHTCKAVERKARSSGHGADVHRAEKEEVATQNGLQGDYPTIHRDTRVDKSKAEKKKAYGLTWSMVYSVRMVVASLRCAR
jgi:hypothetical protein